MTIKKKISIGIITVVCAVLLLFAVEIFIMASNGKLFPVMEENIGKTSEELNEFSPNLIPVLFTPVKALSVLLMSLSTGILILLYGPFRRGIKWAGITIFTMLIVWLALATLIYFAQPNAPWMLWAILLFLVFIALVFDLWGKRT